MIRGTILALLSRNARCVVVPSGFALTLAIVYAFLGSDAALVVAVCGVLWAFFLWLFWPRKGKLGWRGWISSAIVLLVIGYLLVEWWTQGGWR